MLIIDKKADVVTLRNLGASDKLITRIFLFEGRMISLIGAVVGVILGLILCFIQQEFGLLSLGGGNSGGNFVVDAYPVSVHVWDIVIVFGHCAGGGLSFRVVSRALSQPQVAGQVIYLLLLIRLMFVGLYGTAWLLSLFLFFSSFGLMALSG